MRTKTLVVVFLFSKSVFAEEGGDQPRNYCALVDECSIGLGEAFDDEEPPITGLMEKEKANFPELISTKSESRDRDDRGVSFNGESQWEGEPGFFRKIKLDYLKVLGFEHEKFHQTAADVLVHGRSAAVWEIQDQERAIAGLDKMAEAFRAVNLPQAKDAYNACQENCEYFRKQMEEVQKSLDSLEKFRTRATHRRHLLANMICRAEAMIAKNIDTESHMAALNEAPLESSLGGAAEKLPAGQVLRDSSVSDREEKSGVAQRAPASGSSDFGTDPEVRARDQKAQECMSAFPEYFFLRAALSSTVLPEIKAKSEPSYGDAEIELFKRVHRKYQEVKQSGALGGVPFLGKVNY